MKLHITTFMELCEEATIHPAIALEDGELVALIEDGASKEEVREHLRQNA